MTCWLITTISATNVHCCQCACRIGRHLKSLKGCQLACGGFSECPQHHRGCRLRGYREGTRDVFCVLTTAGMSINANNNSPALNEWTINYLVRKYWINTRLHHNIASMGILPTQSPAAILPINSTVCPACMFQPLQPHIQSVLPLLFQPSSLPSPPSCPPPFCSCVWSLPWTEWKMYAPSTKNQWTLVSAFTCI